MAQSNQISLNLQQKDLDEINNAVNVLKTKLLPVLKNLSSTDKIELPKMGDKTVAFVQKALEYCSQNPGLVPPFLDVNEFKIDVKAVEDLKSVYIPLFQITEALNDTIMLSGSEAYTAALMFYTTVKGAMKSKIPNADLIYDDLSNRFPAKNIKKSSGN